MAQEDSKKTIFFFKLYMHQSDTHSDQIRVWILYHVNINKKVIIIPKFCFAPWLRRMCQGNQWAVVAVNILPGYCTLSVDPPVLQIHLGQIPPCPGTPLDLVDLL